LRKEQKKMVIAKTLVSILTGITTIQKPKKENQKFKKPSRYCC